MRAQKGDRETKLLVVVIFLASLSVFLFFIYKMYTQQGGNGGEAGPTANTSTNALDVVDTWETFVNVSVGFQLKYPRLLSVYEYSDTGRYVYFVKFEESSFSGGKGVALGVAQGNYESEVKTLTEEIVASGGEKTNEEDYEVGDYSFTIVNFRAVSPKSEDRSVGFLAIDDFVISISTTPAQIKNVLDTFSYFGQVAGCSSLKQDEIQTKGLELYCNGTLCGGYTSRVECVENDSVSFQNGILTENASDGVPDCLWDTLEESGKNCKPLF